MRIFQRLSILPFLVFVASLSLMVHIGDLVSGVQKYGIAFAQAEVDVEAPAFPSEGAKEEHSSSAEEDVVESLFDGGPSFPDDSKKEEPKWKDATEAEFEDSDVKVGLYKDLAVRRQALETQEHAMLVREALLEAGERELNQKLREMIAVRNEIKGLLQEQSDAEQGRIGSLVKIYEGMKAKDAARIFNTLDTNVLLSVISRMSERKASPVLAEMNPERARTVTILLAQQKQIPSIPQQ